MSRSQMATGWPFFRQLAGASLLPPVLAPHISCQVQETCFVSSAGVRLWARQQGLGELEAICDLLGRGVWPERFRRNFSVLSADQMLSLLRCRVFVLGCGGLGGHVIASLARLGFGRLRLCDCDSFEESNLNRQRFCAESTLGQAKALVAARAARDIASYLEVDAVQARGTAENLPELLQGMDVAIDCLDNIPDRFVLERSALDLGLTFVHGAVLRQEGFAFVNTGPEAMMPSLYPQQAGDEQAESGIQPKHEGIIVTSPAGVANLMCALLLRHLTGKGQKTTPRLYHLDLSVPELESFVF